MNENKTLMVDYYVNCCCRRRSLILHKQKQKNKQTNKSDCCYDDDDDDDNNLMIQSIGIKDMECVCIIHKGFFIFFHLRKKLLMK